MSNIQKNKIEETTSIAVEMYYGKVREIIVRNQRFFNLLVEELVEKGILIDEDIKRLKEECIN